jgi:hypothetical protein
MHDNSTFVPTAIIIAYVVLLTIATYVIKRTVHLAPLHSNPR